MQPTPFGTCFTLQCTQFVQRSQPGEGCGIKIHHWCNACRVLARTEGIMAGVSSGGAVSAALRLSAEVENAVIAVIICDRGDRYLSTGLFNPGEAAV